MCLCGLLPCPILSFSLCFDCRIEDPDIYSWYACVSRANPVADFWCFLLSVLYSLIMKTFHIMTLSSRRRECWILSSREIMIPIFPLGFSFLNIICLSCLCHGKFCTLLKSSQFCWIYYFRFAVIVFKNCMYCYSLWGISVFTEKSAVSFLLQLSIYILCYIYLSVLIMLKGFSFLVLFICCYWGGCYA